MVMNTDDASDHAVNVNVDVTLAVTDPTASSLPAKVSPPSPTIHHPDIIMPPEEKLAIMDSKLLYAPTKEKVASTRIEKFRKRVAQKYAVPLETYTDLWAWSTSRISDFWTEVWHETGIISSVTAPRAIDESTYMDEIPPWFQGARLNFAENHLWRRDDAVAIISTGEKRTPRRITYKQLYQDVRSLAAAFRAQGIITGDRVLYYGANGPECVITMLAAASIGAIFSSASSDFGVKGVLDRFGQIGAKILVSVNAVVYNGKVFTQVDKLTEIVKELAKNKTIETVIVADFADHTKAIEGIPDAVSWIAYLEKGAKLASTEIKFEQLPFDHPLWILYSSGSTSKPKCITHRAGGMLIQSKKELILHGDVSEKDVLFFYTTTGWMMWNWLVGGLATGCQIVLYDGSPFQPSPGALWDMVDELGITIFGTSPKYLQSLVDAKYIPNKRHSLKSIRMLLSTGAPLKPDLFDFVYDSVRNADEFVLGSITGGTDICSLFCAMNAALPVYRGQIQCRGLGMSVQAWDGELNPVVGVPGDLVCTTHFPCQPIFFWNDPERAAYTAAYFSQYPHVWYHGDYVQIDPKTEGVIMLGRSDGTLNPAGVRFGSSEIYEIVDKIESVQDSLCVGQTLPSGEDERVVLFVQLRQDAKWSQDIVAKIKSSIRQGLSARHVPAVILQVHEIPYTVNGKRVEVPVKKLINGTPISKLTTSTMSNPECLKEYVDRPELKFKES